MRPSRILPNWRFFPLSQVNRNWLTLLAGDVGRQVLGLIPSVLIARALAPAGFGYFALIGVITGLGGVLADLGLSQASVMQIARLSRGQRQPLANTFFWLRISAAAVLALVGILLSPIISPLLGLPKEGAVWMALGFGGLLATALSGAVATLLQAAGRFRAITFQLILNTGLTAVGAIILFVGDRLNLTTALLWLGIVPALITFAWGKRQLPLRWASGRLAYSVFRREAPALWRSGRWLWVANGLALLAGQIDLFLLNAFVPAAALGHYGLALNLATKADVLNRSLSTVLLPSVARLTGSAGLKSYLTAGLRRSLVLGLLLLPALALVPAAVTFLYGAAFSPTGSLFRMLLGIVVLDLFALPLLLLPFALKRPKWLALADALRLVLFLPLALVLIPSLGPAGAVLARAVARLAGIALIAILSWRHRTILPLRELEPRAAYARWAPTYPPVAHNPVMVAEENKMRARMPDPAGRDCLDLACGTGRYGQLLRARGARGVWGCDFSAAMLAAAPNTTNLVQAPLHPLPFLSASFDLVVCGLAVGHEVNLVATYAEIARVLRPGGTLLCSDFHPEAATSGFQRTFATRDGQRFAVRHVVHDVADHRRALAAAGLRLTAIDDVYVPHDGDGIGPMLPMVLVVRAEKGGG